MVMTARSVSLQSLELSHDSEHDRVYVAVAKRYAIEPPVVIGDAAIIGFASDGGTAAQYHAASDACRTARCIDPVASILAEEPGSDVEKSASRYRPTPCKIRQLTFVLKWAGGLVLQRVRSESGSRPFNFRSHCATGK
jgi:hypothetical protein